LLLNLNLNSITIKHLEVLIHLQIQEAIGYLSAHPQVDADSMAMIGTSYGADLAIMTACYLDGVSIANQRLKCE
jgi:dipeptidyl aminopeptidase/acylaminoacyl peptidase